MKTWRWFVGQVTRLRRSIVGAFALDAERRARAADHSDVADEPAAGPPEHWVARVRRGAPGLLEPSLRRRGEPAQPPGAERVMPSQTDFAPLPHSPEEPEREYVPPEPRGGPPRRPEALTRPRLWRKVLRRERSVPPPEVDASQAPTADRMSRDLPVATRRVGESAESLAGEPRSRRRPIDETGPTRTRPTPPVAGQPERSPRPTEIVEFEAPPQRLAAGVEWEARPDRPIKAGVARQSAEDTRRVKLSVDEISIDRVVERTVPSPAPSRESNVNRLREPLRPASQPELSAEPGPSPHRRAEPVSAVDAHPWPELPPPLDEVDGDVEAALRAWEHQQRLDLEQTRL
jgi:hypothetical protein